MIRTPPASDAAAPIPQSVIDYVNPGRYSFSSSHASILMVFPRALPVARWQDM